MGVIDLQQQQKEAKEEARLQNEERLREQREAKEEARLQMIEAQKRIERAEQEAAATREALNRANLEHVQANLSAQIEALKGAIINSQNGRADKADIGTTIEGIATVAEKYLGLSRKDPMPPPSSGGDFNSILAMKRLEQEIKREDRRFLLEMKRDERLWQMELKKMENNTRESEEKLRAEKNKYSMLAAIPETLGSSIAKGLMARGEAPAAREPVARTAPPPQVLEAAVGQAGEISCGNCGSTVGVGPTSTSAMCVTCGQRFQIRRIAPPVRREPDPPQRAPEPPPVAQAPEPQRQAPEPPRAQAPAPSSSSSTEEPVDELGAMIDQGLEEEA